MTPAELRVMAQRAKDEGIGKVVVTVRKKRRPIQRASILPGVNGDVLSYDGERAVVLVESADILRWLDRRESRSPSRREP